MSKVFSIMISILISVSFFVTPSVVLAQTEATDTSNSEDQQITENLKVLFSEVSTGTLGSANEEFVEIYNNTDLPLNLTGWKVYYRSASGSSWYKKAEVLSTEATSAKDFLVFSNYLENSQGWGGGMAQSGGCLQLRDADGLVVQNFGWGGCSNVDHPVSANSAGESMERQYDFEADLMQSTNNDAVDFMISTRPTPSTLPSQFLESEQNNPAPTINYPIVKLSELLPDPVSPATDSSDEFIELFNPNSYDVDLSGYVLKDNGGATFVIQEKTITAGGYLIITSANSSISLNNTGDILELYSPSAELLDQSTDYGKAMPGVSWGWQGDGWYWLAVPTPVAQNAVAMTVDEVAELTTKPAKAKATKKSTTKKAAAKKAAKTSPVKAAATIATDQADKSAQNPSFWGWVLAGLAAITVGYGIYEYREEIKNFFSRFRKSHKT